MKLVLMTVALFALVAPAFASDGGGSDGCGLGWQVTSKKSFLGTSTRSTTNGIIPPTFGMTTGTIGCDKHTFALNDMPAVNYVASNKDALMIEMAAGKGENLSALAQTLGCTDTNAFAAKAQAGYANLVNSSSVEFYKNVKALALAQGCTI